MERHRVRFTLSGSLSGASNAPLELIVDGVEELEARRER